MLLVLLACTTGDSATEAPPPTLTLASPADGATVCGTPLVVVTEIGNFTLTNETIEDPPAGIGHMHVYLNGQVVAQADAETVEVNDVMDGVYELKVDLAGADHAPLDPPVEASVDITVSSLACED